MYLKQFNKEGDKYYVNAFTGQTVTIPNVNPLKREPNKEIQRFMSNGSIPLFGSGSKLQILNNQKTVFVGDFKKLMSIEPEKRDKKEFINACKRVNVNPYPLFNTTYDQYYNLIALKP